MGVARRSDRLLTVLRGTVLQRCLVVPLLLFVFQSIHAGEELTIAAAIERLAEPPPEGEEVWDEDGFRVAATGEDELNTAQTFLIGTGRAGIIALDAYFFPDIEGLVQALGAEGYRERNRASERLRELLPRCYPQLKSMQEATDEPEVYYRLKEILAKGSDEIGYESFLDRRHAASIVAIRSDVIIPQNQRLIGDFLRQMVRHNRKDGPTNDDIAAIGRCNDTKLLVGLLMKAFHRQNRRSWADNDIATALIHRLWYLVPKEMPRILGRWKSLVSKASLPPIEEVPIPLDVSLDDLNSLASEIEMRYPESQRRDAARRLIQSSDKARVLLGLHIYNWSEGPADDVLRVIGTVPDRYLWGVHVDCLTDMDEYYPHRHRFLKSGYSVSSFLSLCAYRPEENKQDIAKLMDHPDAELASEAMTFASLFPDESDKVGKIQDRRIRSSDFAIRGIVFNAKRGQFDDWWRAAMDRKRFPAPKQLAKKVPRSALEGMERRGSAFRRWIENLDRRRFRLSRLVR